MSSGAITLQCPQCGGVFLTLQQSGVTEICPHCAWSAPRAKFQVSTDLPGARAHTVLPPKNFAPAAASRVFAEANVPFPIPPLSVPANGHAAPPAPAPTLHAAPSLFAAPRTTPVSAFTTAATVTQTRGAAPIFQNAPPPAPADATAPARAASMPDWPGLGLEEPEGIAPIPAAAAALGTTETARYQLEEAPRRDHKHKRWLVLLAFFTVLAASVGWLALRNQAPVKAPATPPPATSPVPATTPVPREEIKAAIPNNSVGAAPAPTLDPHEDARRMDLVVDEMVKKIEGAKSADDWMPFIMQPDKHRAAVQRFFEKCGGKFGAISMHSSGGKVSVIASGAQERLFSLATKLNPSGAIIQMREKDGKAQMNWPLFEQSHDKQFEAFLKTQKADAGSRWFHLLCQLAHDFELPPASRERWICLQANGSVGGATASVFVNKDSPTGRFLESQVSWGKVYLVELLVGPMEVDGHHVLVALDCAGTRLESSGGP